MPKRCATRSAVSPMDKYESGDVHPLFGLRHSASEDHIFNFIGIELWHAIESALNCNRGKFIRACRSQRAFVGTANGCADGRDQNDFTHWSLQPITIMNLMRKFADEAHS